MHLEHPDQLDLAQPTVTPNIVQKSLLEQHRPASLLGSHVPFDGHLPQRIEHAGAVDRLRASRRACRTRNAFPDRLAPKRAIEPAHLNQPDQLIRQQVHLVGHRTSGRAFAALITIGNLQMRKIILFGISVVEHRQVQLSGWLIKRRQLHLPEDCTSNGWGDAKGTCGAIAHSDLF
jgi:hypothetical protein